MDSAYHVYWDRLLAVAKVKGAFDASGNERKPELLARLRALGEANNASKNLPLTIVKITDYLDDHETVQRERVELVFPPEVLPEFRETLASFLERLIVKSFGGCTEIVRRGDTIEFWGTGDQLSRKVTAPYLEPIVEAFSTHFHSPETGLFVSREFLARDDVARAAEDLGIAATADRFGRLNNVTYHEARRLLDHLGRTMMSASEYWTVLREAFARRDEQLLAHLRSPGFVEFLDTVILDGKYAIDHPRIIETPTGYAYAGERREIAIPVAEPGLILPEDIDPETGFPNVVSDPRQYGDARLWRFWSPDAPVCIPTRGHVFLLNQPAFDLKIHPDDALPNLGVRPCDTVLTAPTIEIVERAHDLIARVVARPTRDDP